MTGAPTASIHTPTRARTPFLGSLALNAQIIGALMMREGTMRFGHENLGFFWVIGEPLALTGGVMAMWTVSGQTHGHGIGVVPFALSGYTMITLWRHLSGRAVHAIRGNMGLLFHRNITLFDVLIARSMLELVAILAAFFIAWTPLMLLGVIEPMSDPLLFAEGYLLQGWFAFSVGLIITALSEKYEVAEQFVPPLLYITLPFTGCFNMAAWLPPRWREAVLWSPLVSNVEMLRQGMFDRETIAYYYPTYVIGWCLVLTAIALPLLHNARKHVDFT